MMNSLFKVEYSRCGRSVVYHVMAKNVFEAIYQTKKLIKEDIIIQNLDCILVTLIARDQILGEESIRMDA